MANVMTFGADNDNVKSTNFAKYKGKAGQRDRVGIVYEDPKQMFRGCLTHYKDKYFVCKSTDEKKAICCTHGYEGNRARWKIGCVLIIYKMDGAKVTGYKLLPWVFSEKMYQKLKTANLEFPLDAHDFYLTCTNEEFQNIDIQSCKDSIWLKKDEFKKKVISEAKDFLEDMSRNLAHDISLEEIRELLGLDTPGSEDAATDVNFGDVIADM